MGLVDIEIVFLIGEYFVRRVKGLLEMIYGLLKGCIVDRILYI